MVTQFLAILEGVKGLAKFGNLGSKDCCSKTDFRTVVAGELSIFFLPRSLFGEFVPKELYSVSHSTLSVGCHRIHLGLLKMSRRV